MHSGSVYLTGDIHLGAVPPATERAFLAWLDHAGTRAGTIVVNGDLFDFWFEYRSVVPRGYARVLGSLAALVDAGRHVVLLGGNHDWWGGDFLREEIGVDFHPDPVVMDLAGRRTFLAHGDGLGRGDLGYRVLRRILRGTATRWAFRWLHPDLGARLARWVSRTEVRGREPTELERSRAAHLEEWARAKLREAPELDLVVLGHTHIPALVEVEADRYYLNAGDWIHHRSFVVLEPEGPPRLEEWGGS